MSRQQESSISGMIILLLVLTNAVLISAWNTQNSPLKWALLITMPLLILAIRDRMQKKHAIIRNFPVIGHLRYFFEWLRPELRQYFIESDTDGKPFSRRQRSLVYQRAKNARQTVPFGTAFEIDKSGYEWISHTVFAEGHFDGNFRVKVGNSQCLQPYEASILNIGAMSYGALSKTAISALNQGARIGNFAHNTGEGGISEYHLMGGDLIWQIGTGYFGCRNENGEFDPIAFRKNATRPEVKMIEVKISQGAKPGHGGILPAAKNTKEIAAIRHVKPGTTIHSPARHTAFDSPAGLLQFLQLLRELSGGKPVGFKMCIGDKSEFVEISRAMIATGIVPDFICVDGAEGGTGAAPLEFTDHIGMPLHDALAFASQTLNGFGLLDDVKIIAAGKIISGFDMLKVFSLGASLCYSSRGMMMALGCIQALACDTGRCPTGVATQDPGLYKGLDPEDKKNRVANFHANTMKAFVEMMEACGFGTLAAIKPSRFFRRINEQEVKSFEDIYVSGRAALVSNVIPLN
jgi:glutamate synthase domain-containing protein 2